MLTPAEWLAGPRRTSIELRKEPEVDSLNKKTPNTAIETHFWQADHEKGEKARINHVIRGERIVITEEVGISKRSQLVELVAWVFVLPGVRV